MAAMEHGQAKLEGLLEGLREAIAGRVQRFKKLHCRRIARPFRRDAR